MEWLDADRPDLSLLSVHGWSVDGVLVSNPPDTWRIAVAAFASRLVARCDSDRSGPDAQRVSGSVFVVVVADLRCAATDCDLLRGDCRLCALDAPPGVDCRCLYMFGRILDFDALCSCSGVRRPQAGHTAS